MAFTELLSEIIDNRGRSCPTAEKGLPLIATNCIKNDGLYPIYETERYVDAETYEGWFRGHPKPGDILFVCKGSPGTVALVPDPVDFCIAQDMVAVRADPSKVYPNYLFAVLRAPQIRDQIYSMHVGSLIPHFKKGDFHKLRIPILSESEQRFIGDAYVELSQKIESNQRSTYLIKSLIKVEYQKATSGVPEVPFTNVLEVEMGSPFSGEMFSEPGNGRPLIRIRDLKTFTPQVWTMESRSDEIVVRCGDVLVGMDAEFKSTIWLGVDGVLNQRLCRFSGKQGIGTAFTSLSIQRDLEFCERAKSGTTVIHLNKADIDRFQVPDLNDKDHLSLLQATEPLVELMKSKSLETRSLELIRETLLPELLSGRIRVSDAESILDGAA